MQGQEAMVQNVPRSAAAWQECRHSREPFDQGFHIVSHRADLSSDARLLHAFLVSLHRTGRQLTQAEMADEIGLTRHRVWASIRELVAAGLIDAVRVGLGQPNRYVLLGLESADLDGTARPETTSRPARRRFPASPESPRAGTYSPKRTTEEPGYIQPGRHYGYTQPPRSGSLMRSRYGLVRR